MSTDCLFCKVIAGDVPSERVADNDAAVAFRDIQPQAPTHVLVVPRRHIDHAHALEPGDGDVLAAMFQLAQQVAEAEGIAQGGYRLVFNVGDDAGNTVGHLHLHVLGGRRLSWPPG